MEVAPAIAAPALASLPHRPPPRAIAPARLLALPAPPARPALPAGEPLDRPGIEDTAAARSGVPEPDAGVRLRRVDLLANAWEDFLGRLKSGAGGLWIGRVFPARLEDEPAAAGVRRLWLSEAGRDNAVSARSLDGLAARITRCIAHEEIRAILFEEVDYLLLLHSEPAVRKFLDTIDRVARANGARVLVVFEPALLSAPGLDGLISSRVLGD
jgi:hypothetical protein